MPGRNTRFPTGVNVSGRYPKWPVFSRPLMVVVKEVLVSDDTIVIRHCIPVPSGPPPTDPGEPTDRGDPGGLCNPAEVDHRIRLKWITESG